MKSWIVESKVVTDQMINTNFNSDKLKIYTKCQVKELLKIIDPILHDNINLPFSRKTLDRIC